MRPDQRTLSRSSPASGLKTLSIPRWGRLPVPEGRAAWRRAIRLFDSGGAKGGRFYLSILILRLKRSRLFFRSPSQQQFQIRGENRLAIRPNLFCNLLDRCCRILALILRDHFNLGKGPELIDRVERDRRSTRAYSSPATCSLRLSS